MLLKNPTNGRTIVGEVKALQGNGIRGTKDKQKILDSALWLYDHMGFFLTTAPLIDSAFHVSSSSITRKTLPVFLRKRLQQYTSNFDSHWSTGLMLSMKTWVVICSHDDAIWRQKFSFICPTYRTYLSLFILTHFIGTSVNIVRQIMFPKIVKSTFKVHIMFIPTTAHNVVCAATCFSHVS